MPKAHAAARNTELREKRWSSVGLGGSTPVSAAPASRRFRSNAFRSVEMTLDRRGECGGLEQGQQRDQIVGAHAPLSGGERPLGAHELGRGGEELHTIEPLALIGGRRNGIAQPDQAGRSFAVQHDVPRPRVAVGDPRLVQAPQVRPRVVKDGISETSGVGLLQARTRRVLDDDEGVVAPPGKTGNHELRHLGPGSAGEEQHVGLVLHLRGSSPREARAGVLVPDGPPDLGEEAGVGAVAADDVDRELGLGPSGVGGAAPRLLGGEAQPARVDAEITE